MIISRYLVREVVNSLLIITAILLLIFLCHQTVRYLNYVALGKIPIRVLLKLISFEIPNLFALLLPLGLYLGIMLAYGRLYVNNEMAILQMSGFNSRRLLQLTIIISLGITTVVLFLMLYVNPIVSLKRQQVMASDEAMLHLIETLIPGRFQASHDGHHIMYVEKLSRDKKRAQNVFLAQSKNDEDDEKQNAWGLVVAKQGYQVKDKKMGTPFFVTTDGYRYEGVAGEKKYRITQFKKYQIRLPQNDVHITHQDTETLSVAQLWQAYDTPKAASELQWRFSIPISTLLLAFLAVPFSAMQPRKSRYLIIFPAILIYVVYVDMLFIARRWVEQEVVPIWAGIWWVHGLALLCILLAIFIHRILVKKMAHL